mgnify:CR=1 FL=1
MIVAENLIKRYGPLTVLKGIDVRIPRGRVTGVIGHNGSGKTTTIKLLLGLLDHAAGSVRVLGLDPVTQGEELMHRLTKLEAEVA